MVERHIETLTRLLAARRHERQSICTLEEEETMNRASFAALTRRASLATLGAAELAFVKWPAPASAKKKGDKFKKCKKQVDDCRTLVLTECDDPPAQCTVDAACCDELKRCRFDSFMFCLSAEGAVAPRLG